MDNVKQQIIDRIKQGTNVLVTVSNNPTVDQLASCIGLTLMLNKLGKHATAVYSGETPPIMEFLEPSKTIEKNTDSLRDFIIALDKSKADKLRYKVEDKVVKIFITPYKTSISEKDLIFGEGDFNVDIIIALGVHNQGELDQAIASHGRILHDATVISINDTADGTLGSLNLIDQSASSLSELITQFDGVIGKPILDGQIATALLTGIVAETDRFSNEKTTPLTMSTSAKLMAAGANQQLVSVKLEEPKPIPPVPIQPPPVAPPVEPTPPPKPDAPVEIYHQPDNSEQEQSTDQTQKGEEDIRIDNEGTLHNNLSDEEIPQETQQQPSPVNSVPEQPAVPQPPPDNLIPENHQMVDTARDAVETAIDSEPPDRLPAIESLNAQPVFTADDNFLNQYKEDAERPSGEPAFGMPQLLDEQFRNGINPSTGASSAPVLQDHPQNTLDMPMPSLMPPQPSQNPVVNDIDTGNQPPPVPPPMISI